MIKDAKFLSKKLIAWYSTHKRDLPWRNTDDPYVIWLSEIILQQTRVAQGLPYFEKFIKTFPTVNHMAQAAESEILRLWQGLGYYSRARNLHACAKYVVENYDGKFPNSFQDLLTLKGVGKYTAAAIASFAHQEMIPVVDGNVYRVLARIFGINKDIASGKGQKFFFEEAKKHIDNESPDIYNQAIMEFGALQCVPINPPCHDCIFSSICYANLNNEQKKLPVKIKKLKIRQRHFNYFIFHDNTGILMKERTEKDIWRGLYDFFLLESNGFMSPNDFENNPFLNKLLKKGAILTKESKTYKHILTHQRIFAQFFHIEIKAALIGEDFQQELLQYYTLKQVNALPKPILIHNYLKEFIF